MTSCKSNCNSCKPKQIIRRYVREDISEYLAPFPKERSDNTPLSRLCTCDPPQRIRRYQCWLCIKSFVEAYCECEILKTIKDLKKKKLKIASERVEEAFKQKQRKRVYGNASNPRNSKCRNCSCKSDR